VRNRIPEIIEKTKAFSSFFAKSTKKWYDLSMNFFKRESIHIKRLKKVTEAMAV
jgi:hypothetical protein